MPISLVITTQTLPSRRRFHQPWNCFHHMGLKVRKIVEKRPKAKGCKEGFARSTYAKKRVDTSDSLTPDAIRYSLVQQEDSIIFALLERSQYCYHPETYAVDAYSFAGFYASLAEYMLRETEKLSAQLGRYNSPAEHPFFPDNLPEPVLPPLQYPKILHPVAECVNINKKVWDTYFTNLLPKLVEDDDDDDGNSSSAAVCDTICLQALSKHIHYGKFVAEAKFQASPTVYKAAIIRQDPYLLMNLLTYEDVEDTVKTRVETKGKTFGQDVPINPIMDLTEPVYKIKPVVIADLYSDWIMPLTKEVQVQYLLGRHD